MVSVTGAPFESSSSSPATARVRHVLTRPSRRPTASIAQTIVSSDPRTRNRATRRHRRAHPRVVGSDVVRSAAATASWATDAAASSHHSEVGRVILISGALLDQRSRTVQPSRPDCSADVAVIRGTVPTRLHGSGSATSVFPKLTPCGNRPTSNSSASVCPRSAKVRRVPRSTPSRTRHQRAQRVARRSKSVCRRCGPRRAARLRRCRGAAASAPTGGRWRFGQPVAAESTTQSSDRSRARPGSSAPAGRHEVALPRLSRAAISRAARTTNFGLVLQVL